MLVMLTGYSAPPGSWPGAWPDPQVRAGLRSVAGTGVQARAPRIRPAGPYCPVPASVTTAIDRARPDQVLFVTGKDSRARVIGCERVDDGYVQVLGPFVAWIGRHSIAPRATKREGDGRTPAGVFALRSGFGTAENPGLDRSFGWFKAGRRDVWVDDPASRSYNTHQRRPVHGRWRSAEQLRIAPYRTAQVIGYNRARTPGRGSAIFLHVSTGRPTAGCIALPAAELRAVMRWERADAVIAIS
jgi:L,D-peptidoglycan transpeptidase YkuD (ErfK/YbiS/YcfS/YnhG family)